MCPTFLQLILKLLEPSEKRIFWSKRVEHYLCAVTVQQRNVLRQLSPGKI
jgi:hypothetical protein